MAAGTVDAAVDFSGLSKDGVKVSDDRRSVTITLPAATLTEARLDPSRSRVYDRDRGLFNRVEDLFADNPADEQPLLRAGDAQADRGRQGRPRAAQGAQENTQRIRGDDARARLRRVTVRFEPAS